MATVYRARHTLQDKPVAIKLFRKELAKDPEAARALPPRSHEHLAPGAPEHHRDHGVAMTRRGRLAALW